MYHLYPRLLAVHDLDATIALPHSETGVVEMPWLMRGSHVFMQEDGIYLIGRCSPLVKTNELKKITLSDTADNEELQVIWVGQSASPQLLLDLFGVDDIFKLDVRIVRVPIFFNKSKNNNPPTFRSSPLKDRASSFGHPFL
jgi:protein transport protein SEC24